MNDTLALSTRASVRRRSWLVIAAAAAALGLLTAVAADSPEPNPAVPQTATDDDGVYRRLVNEGQIPRPARDDARDVTRQLPDRRQIPEE